MKKIIIGIIILAILVVFGFYFAQANSVSPVKIGYSIGSVNHAPVVVAYEKGFFEKNGVSVEMVPLKSSSEVKQALSTGSIHFGSGGFANFFVPISKGAPIKIIASSTLTPTYLFVRPDSNILTLKDLEGRRISSGAFGGNSDYEIRYILKDHNIDLKKIEFVETESTFLPIALMEKKIVDVAMASESREISYQKAGAVILKEWGDDGFSAKNRLKSVIAVYSPFLEENPRESQAFMNAFIDAQEFIKKNPQEASILVARHINEGTGGASRFSAADIEKSWEKMRYSFWEDPQQIVDSAQIGFEYGFLDRNLSINDLMDFRFEEKLKAAQARVYGPQN